MLFETIFVDIYW